MAIALAEAGISMKVNLYIFQIDASDFKPSMEWELILGSSPRKAGEKVEEMEVPNGKVWLFPLGGDFASIEKVVKGVRLIRAVNI